MTPDERRKAARDFLAVTAPGFKATPPVRDNWAPCCESFPAASRHISEAQQDSCFDRQVAMSLRTDFEWRDLAEFDVVPERWRSDA